MPSVGELHLSSTQRAVVERFAALSRSDERIRAAFIGGSHAHGTADEHSDLDLFLVVADGYIGALRAARIDLLQQLGDPLFSDTFGSDHTVCFILASNSRTIQAISTLDSSLDSAHRVAHSSISRKSDSSVVSDLLC